MKGKTGLMKKKNLTRGLSLLMVIVMSALVLAALVTPVFGLGAPGSGIIELDNIKYLRLFTRSVRNNLPDIAFPKTLVHKNFPFDYSNLTLTAFA